MATTTSGASRILGCCFFFLYVMTVHGVFDPYDMVYEMCFPESYEEDFIRKEGMGVGFLDEVHALEGLSDWVYRASDLKETDEPAGPVYYSSAACDKALSKDECEECIDMSRMFLEEDCGHRLGARVHLKDCGIRFDESYYLQ